MVCLRLPIEGMARHLLRQVGLLTNPSGGEGVHHIWSRRSPHSILEDMEYPMGRYVRSLALTLAFLSLPAVCAPPTWYVSPKGNDAWSGALPEPNADRTDGPKATLVAARDTSRSKRGEVRRIVLAEGRYFLDKSLDLSPADSKLTIEGAGMGKTIVYGGRRLTGWQKAEGPFWSAELGEDWPDWSFRVLVVDDAIQERARFPETGYLEHETKFGVRWMSTAGGGWERKPTLEERTTMQYKAGDLPDDLRAENAEITVCHMWDESTVPLGKIEPASRTLTLAQPSHHPPGAFRVQRYVVWNTKEGMKRPGQWYLDKVERKVYYWPAEGMDMTQALVVAPTMESLIRVAGKPGKAETHVTDVVVRDLTLSVSEAPMRPAGFGASQWPGAVRLTYADRCMLERVEVSQAGGWGIQEWAGKQFVAKDCRFHHLGGGGVRFGSGACIEGNQIHDIGLVSASSIGIMGGGKNSVIRRNVIHDTPYSGMCVGGTETLIEENLIYRCMLVHHDGAAIYMGGGKRCVIRRNLARDMVQIGKGYGVSAYYLDEKCQECVVAENVAINIPHPSQNHMTLNCELRDNVFIAEEDMKIAFSRCSGHKVTGNTFHLGGKLKVHQPDAITDWQRNLLFVRGKDGGEVLEDVPRAPFTPRDKPRYYKPIQTTKAPVIDGKMEDGEWPSGGTSLNERTNQRSVRGAPTSVKILADKQNLYVLTNVVSMFPKQRKRGTEWGKDEGVELTVEVKHGDRKVVHVLHGFTDGTLRSLSIAGASAEQAKAFLGKVTYGASVEGKLWRSEWSIPLSVLGVEPGQKTILPLNITAYRSEDDVFAQFAGTLGETWDLERGGRLMMFWDSKETSRRPEIRVPTVKNVAGQWPGKAVALAQTPSAVPLPGPAGAARVVRSGDLLLVRVAIPAKTVTKGGAWRTDDGAEVCLAGKTADGKPVTWVVRGYANGACWVSSEAGTPEKVCRELQKKVRYAAKVTDGEWQGEWHLPLAALGIAPKGRVPFNLGAFRSSTREWMNWVGTSGPTWKLEKAGQLVLD